MIDFFKAGLEAQKKLLDMQAGQIRVFEDLMKAAQGQVAAQKTLTQATEAQMTLFDNWLGLWGVKR